MLNQEVTNRWQVMTAVVDHKKEVIDSTQKQMRLYEEAVKKLMDLLNRAEATLAAQSAPGTDVNKAKANRDTLKVCVNCERRFLPLGNNWLEFFFFLSEERPIASYNVIGNCSFVLVQPDLKTQLSALFSETRA